ncbi:MAG: hypothetical protein DRN30_00395 [Thermoplasmata archaeon]|nr:MAG: hypothetical protein DRN30_00395 [Thermoplasmata archaeon]
MHLLLDFFPILFPFAYFLSKYFWGKTQRSKRTIFLGYLILILWAIATCVHEFRERDYGNVMILLMVLFFAFYLIIFRKEILLWGFVPQMISIMVLLYFPLKIMDNYTHMITYGTAYFTYLLTKLFFEDNLYIGLANSKVFIKGIKNVYYFTFACTGIQSIAIVVSPLMATHSRVCLKRAVYIAGLIYVLNIMRGALIILLVERLSWDYYLVHTILMKGFSIVVIMIIFYYVLVSCEELTHKFKELSRKIFRMSKIL